MANIGNVAHVAHLVSEESKVTVQQIESNKRAGVPQVRVAVNGWSANVQTHMTFHQRFKRFLLPAQRIVNIKLTHNFFEIV